MPTTVVDKSAKLPRKRKFGQLPEKSATEGFVLSWSDLVSQIRKLQKCNSMFIPGLGSAVSQVFKLVYPEEWVKDLANTLEMPKSGHPDETQAAEVRDIVRCLALWYAKYDHLQLVLPAPTFAVEPPEEEEKSISAASSRRSSVSGKIEDVVHGNLRSEINKNALVIEPPLSSPALRKSSTVSVASASGLVIEPPLSSPASRKSSTVSVASAATGSNGP